ncbi:esterase [Sulfurifustis variabilis]|uniref:Esterase n=1 Tax=Sulfurifustis variabilis TaxID=1675686 RepID=A0A1C7AFH8_9GAMM|nr:arylesterase [Sulfurifustis variabilis]BAU50082.1 esterase [Sulfurifustis variabilis]
MRLPFTCPSISLRLVFVLALLLAPGAVLARTILVVGDSLSASYGIDVESGWVARLQQRLEEHKLNYKVINASISGDTTANGRVRLPRALAQHEPAVVVLELGGNDGLRGLPLEEMKRNLAAMIEESKKSGAEVVLIGIRLPPNYGPRYNERFRAVYEDLAARYRLPLVPFLLDGVYEQDGLMQPDGIHPTAAAQARMLDNVWPKLRPVLKR